MQTASLEQRKKVTNFIQSHTRTTTISRPQKYQR